MKQLPYSVIETAVNALHFCIITRDRVDANGGPVICCPPSNACNQLVAIASELTLRGLYNDVIDDALTTVAVSSIFVLENHRFPLINNRDFQYTTQQYAVALQQLLSALTTSDGKE